MNRTPPQALAVILIAGSASPLVASAQAVSSDAGAAVAPAAPSAAPTLAAPAPATESSPPAPPVAPAAQPDSAPAQPVTPLYSSPPQVPVEPPPAAPEGSIRDMTVHRRPMALSTMAFVPWWYGIGIGASVAFEIPVVHDGFIPSVNDQFSIEPSFSFAYTTWRDSYSAYDHDYGLMFRPAVAALWSFHFSSKLRAYAELNIGYTRINRSYDFGTRNLSVGYNYFYGELNVGMFYNFSRHVALRAELGFYGFRAGLAFLL